MRRWQGTAGVGTVVLAMVMTGCRGASPPAEGSNAVVRAATSAEVCPERSDAIIWSGDGLRLLAVHAGREHRNEVIDAATAWGRTVGTEVDIASLALYGSPVPFPLVGRLTGDPSPDLVEGFLGGVMLSCALEHRVTDLTELWATEGWDVVVPEAVRELATVDGRRLAVPTTVQWNPVWYRPDVFADLDLEPPRTWDELLVTCEVLRDAGVQPISLGVSNWSPPVARWFSHLDLGLNGADFHEGLLAGVESWTDPRVTAVFDHWRELLERGCFGQEPGTGRYVDAITAVVDGHAGMLDLGSWIHESLDPDESAVLAPFPFPTLDRAVPRTEIATVQGLMIPVTAEQPDLARELLLALASADRLASAHATLGRTPVRTDVEVTLDDWQQTERQAIEGADRLVQLLEFSAEPLYASAILGALTAFLRSPDSLDTQLERLEDTRLGIFEEPIT